MDPLKEPRIDPLKEPRMDPRKEPPPKTAEEQEHVAEGAANRLPVLSRSCFKL